MGTDIVTRIDDVDIAAWNALAGGSFYAGDAWMRYQEADPSTAARYVLVRDEQDRLVAGMPVYMVSSEGSSLYDPARLFPFDGQGPEKTGRTSASRVRHGHADRRHRVQEGPVMKLFSCKNKTGSDAASQVELLIEGMH
ncbi:hypothetical protein [Streptomyces sp. NBC_01443]|uniref:hypothetical protein n=1 Tax=Streptomyces sp. NBC_01443 TaxID=2903868 RepID=UPI002259E329|nr:hypothetical protein [Streptomyces sp. NBC_01443]MCX4632355.1 hypothetical protein [Streptomyces sp. NBC_01443]